MVFLSADAGVRGFRSWLVSHGFSNISGLEEVYIGNKHYHYKIITDQQKFYCLFKHNFFFTFPEKYKLFFDKYPNLNSAGESINFDRLMFALNNGFTLVFIYESGAFYSIDPKDILNVHVLAKDVYPDGFIREQKKENEYKVAYSNGVVELVNERTISFPIKLLRRMNSWNSVVYLYVIILRSGLLLNIKRLLWVVIELKTKTKLSDVIIYVRDCSDDDLDCIHCNILSELRRRDRELFKKLERLF